MGNLAGGLGGVTLAMAQKIHESRTAINHIPQSRDVSLKRRWLSILRENGRIRLDIQHSRRRDLRWWNGAQICRRWKTHGRSVRSHGLNALDIVSDDFSESLMVVRAVCFYRYVSGSFVRSVSFMRYRFRGFVEFLIRGRE